MKKLLHLSKNLFQVKIEEKNQLKMMGFRFLRSSLFLLCSLIFIGTLINPEMFLTFYILAACIYPLFGVISGIQWVQYSKKARDYGLSKGTYMTLAIGEFLLSAVGLSVLFSVGVMPVIGLFALGLAASVGLALFAAVEWKKLMSTLLDLKLEGRTNALSWKDFFSEIFPKGWLGLTTTFAMGTLAVLSIIGLSTGGVLPTAMIFTFAVATLLSSASHLIHDGVRWIRIKRNSSIAENTSLLVSNQPEVPKVVERRLTREQPSSSLMMETTLGVGNRGIVPYHDFSLGL